MYIEPLVVIATIVGLTSPSDLPAEQDSEATVHFPLGSVRIGSDVSAKLKARVKVWLQDERDLLVLGHADRTGAKALNQNLSRRRAEAVAEVLVQAGFPRERLQVVGAGYSSPRDSGSGPEADAANRRVEVWRVVPESVGWVSWRHRQLEASTPKRPWFEAFVNLSVAVRHRLRTIGQSAGEVTFRQGYILHLGPHGSLIIYTPRSSRQRQEIPVADVKLEQGSLLARLPEDAERPLSLATDASSVTGRSRRLRVEYDRLKTTSLISVYDGRVRVAAQGASVAVREGYGTRVQKGKRPERPTRLPQPPVWQGKEALQPVLSLGATTLKWRTKYPRTRVEITTVADPRFQRVQTATVTADSSLVLDDLRGAETYFVRLQAIDKKGLIGVAGPVRTIHRLDLPDRLPQPAEVAPSLAGYEIAFRPVDGTKTTTVATLSYPGEDQRFTVQVNNLDGTLSAEKLWTVEVEPLRLVESSSTCDAVFLETLDSKGQLSHEFEPQVAIVEEKAEPCGGMVDDSDNLRLCSSIASRGDASVALLEKLSTGRFRLSRSPQTYKAVVFDVVNSRHLGRTLVVEPISCAPPEAPSFPRWRIVTGMGTGILARDAQRFAGVADVHFGLQTELSEESAIRSLLEMSFARAIADPSSDNDVSFVPIVFSLQWVGLGADWRPWVSLGGGARFVSRSEFEQTRRLYWRAIGRFSMGLSREIMPGGEGYIGLRLDISPWRGSLGSGWDGLVMPTLNLGIRGLFGD